MSVRAVAVVVAAVALVGLLGWGLISQGEETLEIGDEIPVSELPVLGKEGETGSLADYEGKWVLVNTWASWCGPCREEAPALQRFYERYRSPSFEIVGIDTEDAVPDGRDFVAEYELSYPMLHDGSGEYADELRTTGVPESFLVNPSGRISFIRRGPITAECLKRDVAPLITAASLEDPPQTCTV